MRIALFDYHITRNNPAGSCHRRILEGLCQEHDFTVFSISFDNPCPERIRWIQIPVPRRPLVLQFVLFHLLAPFYYRRAQHKQAFDLVQFVESNLSFGDISYAHFCHRAFLQSEWKHLHLGGLRGWFRWLNYACHALLEPLAFAEAKHIVVPSEGLAHRIRTTYPSVAPKIQVIPNPVDVARFACPATFDRVAFRKRYSLSPEHLVLVFIALGNFEHKGLPLVLEALQHAEREEVALFVVGGPPDLVSRYQTISDNMNLSDRVVFTGMQSDVRPFLWGSDVFILPSIYETFPLVALEAAASGLPIIATDLNGVRDFLENGKAGLVIERRAAAIQEALEVMLNLPVTERIRYGENARLSIQQFDTSHFISRWASFYHSLRS